MRMQPLFAYCHRGALARQQQEAKQLTGAVQQVEVAEEALRDSHATASRLLQECTEARRANQELQGQVNTLSRQLQGLSSIILLLFRVCILLLYAGTIQGQLW